jgi:hypothetical protein
MESTSITTQSVLLTFSLSIETSLLKTVGFPLINKFDVGMCFMRSSLLPLALCVFCSAGFLKSGRAQVFDETMRQKVTIDAEATTSDDALLAMARAAKVNVIADATEFKNNATTPLDFPAYKQSGALGSYLLEMSDARNLSWTRPDAKTFLVWKRPDIDALAKRIVAGEEMRHRWSVTIKICCRTKFGTRLLSGSVIRVSP